MTLPSTAQMRFALTITLGIWIPLFSLGLSHVGGTLLQQDKTVAHLLGLMALGLMACVLVVSLSHLAWAVGNITRSPLWASWLLAVSFDLALVLGELTHVAASEAGLGLVMYSIMCAVCVLSMFLNCWAFLKHPTDEKRQTTKNGKKENSKQKDGEED